MGDTQRRSAQRHTHLDVPGIRKALELYRTHIGLQAVNVGNLHVQVADLRLSSGGQLAGQMSTPAYVLPGQTRAWTVKLAKPLQPDVGPIQLEGFSDAGDVKVSVPLR
jgi:P pilus assembly chaperone PapD